MTSRKLFLADCIENYKRRNWVFWLQFLTFFFAFPGALLLELNSIFKREYYDEELLMGTMYSCLENAFNIGAKGGLVIILGILAGIQAFCWLHHKQQVNFYHSQPVSRNRRFAVIWFNGVVSFLVSYVINLALGMLVAASYGFPVGVILEMVLQTFWANLFLFLNIYHISIVAVMLTGHTLVSLIGVVVLLVYEIAIRALFVSLASFFFQTFSRQWENQRILDTLFSPVVTFFVYAGSNQSVSSFNYGIGRVTYSETIFTMAGLALLFGLMGWLLYKARASENHEKSISFSWLKEPLKILLLLVFGLTGGMFIYTVSGKSDVLGIGGAIFATVIGHAVIQLIYEVDFRAIRKGLVSLGLSILLVTFAFAVFRWDILGYDKRIPKQEKVESVAISLEIKFGIEYNTRILSDGNPVNPYFYQDKEMELTDLDMVYRLLDNRISEEKLLYDERVHSLDVVFNLKNGRTQYRTLYFNYEENLEVMNEIFHTPEYQQSTNQVMEEDFVSQFNIFGMEYENGQNIYAVPSEQVIPLWEAYVKDVYNSEFGEINSSIPVGRLRLTGKGIQHEDNRNYWWVTIYPSFSNTISLLNQHGIATEIVYSQDYMDRIQNIIVSRDKEERIIFVNEKFREDFNRGSYHEDFKVTYYEEWGELKEILDAAYLDELIGWNRYEGADISDAMDIKVKLYEPGHLGDENYTYYENYYLDKGDIPESVLQMIKEASK